MTLTELCVHKHLAHRRRKAQQTQLVGNRGLLLAYARSHSLLRDMELVHELLVALSLLQIMQVLTLQVLDKRDFGNLLAGIFADNHRHLSQLRHFGRTQTAFSGDEHIAAILRRRNQQRLQHAILSNRGRQIL